MTKDYNVYPKIDHQACMFDLYGFREGYRREGQIRDQREEEKLWGRTKQEE